MTCERLTLSDTKLPSVCGLYLHTYWHLTHKISSKHWVSYACTLPSTRPTQMSDMAPPPPPTSEAEGGVGQCMHVMHVTARLQLARQVTTCRSRDMTWMSPLSAQAQRWEEEGGG